MRFLSHQATAEHNSRAGPDPGRTDALAGQWLLCQPAPPKSFCESLTMSLFAATTTANSQES